MKLIVAVDNKWGIGRDGKLLFNIPSDMKYFKEKTTGKTVIMGRKTLQSFPNGKPLPNRRNIVLSRQTNLTSYDNLTVINSFDELFKIVDINHSEDVFLIGGAEIYNSLLNYCDQLYITKVEADGQADTFLTNIDEHPDYVCSLLGDIKEENGYKFRFTVYSRKIHM